MNTFTLKIAQVSNGTCKHIEYVVHQEIEIFLDAKVDCS